jgi:hypothetical protein
VLEVSQSYDFRFQFHAKGCPRGGLGLVDQGEHFLGSCPARIHEDVGMLLRETMASPIRRPLKPSSSSIWPVGLPKRRSFLKRLPAQG